MAASGIRMGGVFVEIGADAAQFFAAINKANASLARMGKAVQLAGAKMAGLGVGVIAPIFASAKAFADVGSSLNDMSVRTGVATEALSVLKFAAEQTGTDMGGVETAVKKMQKAIYAAGNGSKEAADALAMVGVSAGDLAGLTADQQMGRIADGLMEIKDPGTRAAVALALFGRSGTDVLPMLEGGSAGMAQFAAQAAKLGLVMDSQTAAKADALGDALDSLKSAMKAAFIQVGSSIAPILTKLAGGLAVLAANVGQFVSENEQFVISALKIGSTLVVLGGALSGIGTLAVAASNAFSVLGIAAVSGVAPLRLMVDAASAIDDALVASSNAAAQFATQAASSLSQFALSGIGSVRAFSFGLKDVFDSQLRISRFIGKSFGGPVVRAFYRTARSIDVIQPAFIGMENAARFAGRGFSALSSDIQRIAPATTSFVSSVAQSMSAYVASVSHAVTSTVSGAAGIASAWISGALRPIYAFVAGAIAGIASYVSATASAAAASISNAVSTGVAWLTSALPALSAFVSGAVAGLSAYLGATAAAAAASVRSAAGIVVAWLAPLAPLALLVAALGGAVAIAYTFKDSIVAAFSGLGGYVSQAAGVIGETFGPAVADAQVVFGDLYATASTTFSGIYDAITAGDLSGAMDILWAGLQAGWLRGVEALMSYVDPFVSTLQNTFTIVGAEIYKVWDSTWVAVGNSFNTVGAYLAGMMDNVINGLLASWDTLEAGIRKAWVSIQSVFGNGQQKQAELEAIDAEMSARADARNASRPGVNGRVETASEQNQAASKALNERTAAVDAATADTMAGRERVNAERAASRREETMTAQQRLAALTADISKATTVPQDAAAGASVADAAAVAPAEIPPPPDTTSQAKVAGTFSSLNLGATFGGTSAAERTAKATEEIAKNTRDMRSDTVAA